MGPIILVVEVVELCIKPTFGFQNNNLINHKNICSLLRLLGGWVSSKNLYLEVRISSVKSI
jgi:hypothetical protein